MSETSEQFNGDVTQVLPLRARGTAKPDLMGSILVESRKISRHDVDKILHYQQERGLRFGEAAVAMKMIKPRDVEAALAQQFSFSVVPVSGSRLDPVLEAAFKPYNARIEALRGLRSELMMRFFDKAEQRILPLLSIDDDEESGELAANLAIVFSQTGARTLLIDANLRRPSLHELFDLPNRQGLSDILAGRSSINAQLCTPLQSLWLLNGGTLPPNPQELLSHQRYRSLTAQLSKQFDIVLVHTASLPESADAQLIADRAGAALLLAQEHVTSLSKLEQVSRRLQDLGVALVGVALSK